MKDLWILEWSHEANTFHVQELKRSIDGWRRHFLANSAPNDWVPILWAPSKKSMRRQTAWTKLWSRERKSDESKTARKFEKFLWPLPKQRKGLSKYNAATLAGWKVLRFTEKSVRDGSAVELVARYLRVPPYNPGIV